jgi:hypothetical protein
MEERIRRMSALIDEIADDLGLPSMCGILQEDKKTPHLRTKRKPAAGGQRTTASQSRAFGRIKPGRHGDTGGRGGRG